MIKNLFWSSCKLHGILVRFERNLNFLDRFSKNTQIPNFVQICSVGAELFRAEGRTDGQTDMLKPVVFFHDFVNAPKTA